MKEPISILDFIKIFCSVTLLREWTGKPQARRICPDMFFTKHMSDEGFASKIY